MTDLCDGAVMVGNLIVTNKKANKQGDIMEIVKGKCGTDCNTCRFKEKFNCGGCAEQKGKIFWGECDIYKCAAEKNFKHCGECPELPCKSLMDFIENRHNPNRLANLNVWKNEEL